MNFNNDLGTISSVSGVTVSGDTFTISGTGAIQPTVGNTSQRPVSPTVGSFRYNTDFNISETWNGSTWLTGATAQVSSLTDAIITSPVTGQVLSYNGTKWVNTSPITQLSSLTDATISTPSVGQHLTYNGSKWVNSAIPSVTSATITAALGFTPLGSASVSNLTDTTITSPVTGQQLTYNGTKWINSTPAAPSIAMSSLTDATITTPTSGQVLSYNGSKWINSAIPSVTSATITAALGFAPIGSVSVSNLTDATITSPTSGQHLVFNGTKWTNSTVASPSMSLSSLTDATITSPVSNQVLSYNGSKWVNSAIPSVTASTITAALGFTPISSTLSSPLLLPVGSPNAPAVAFSGTQTGLYEVNSNTLGFSAGGTAIGYMTPTGLNNMIIGATNPSTGAFTSLSSVGTIGAGAGSPNSPSFYFNSTNTGLYEVNQNALGFSMGGNSVGYMTSTGLNSMAIGATTPSTGAFTSVSSVGTIGAGAGSPTSPSFVFNSTSTGLYELNSTSVGFSSGGNSVGYVSNTGLNSMSIGATNPSTGSFTTLSTSTGLNLPVGSPTAPSLYFNGTQTGIYEFNSSSLAFTSAGTSVGYVSNTGINSMAIGATTPSTGSFTNLSVSGTFSMTGASPAITGLVNPLSTATSSAATVGYVNNALTVKQVGSGEVYQTIASAIAAASNTTTITLANTTPTTSNGTQVWSQVITPHVTTSKIVISGSFPISLNTANKQIILMMFRGTTCIGVTGQYTSAANSIVSMSFSFSDSPASTAQQTYTIRMASTASATWYVGAAPTAYFNGMMALSDIILQEVA